MGNNKKNGQPQYAPSHLGTKPVKYKRNKGEKMHDTSGQRTSYHADERRVAGLILFKEVHPNDKKPKSISALNPDDRSDNVEKLQDMVQNTIENIEEAEESMEFASGEDKQRHQRKNARREESIEAFRNEIQDESEARENGYRS